MKRKELKAFCNTVALQLEQQPYGHWRTVSFPCVYTEHFAGNKVGVELNVLEDTQEYLHIGVAVDDDGCLSAFLPVCSSFIVKKIKRL